METTRVEVLPDDVVMERETALATLQRLFEPTSKAWQEAQEQLDALEVSPEAEESHLSVATCTAAHELIRAEKAARTFSPSKTTGLLSELTEDQLEELAAFLDVEVEAAIPDAIPVVH